MPKTPPLVMDSSRLASIFGSSSSSEPQLAWAPREDWLTSGAVPAPSPLPRGGAPLDTPPAAPEEMDEVGHAFEFERGRSIVCHELFQEAMGAMSRLGEELAGVDSRLEAEGLRLAEERRKLRLAINLGRYQCDLDNANAEASVSVKTSGSQVGVPNCASKADGNRRQGTQCYPGSGPLDGGNTLLPA